jgi:hypothetical protein
MMTNRSERSSTVRAAFNLAHRANSIASTIRLRRALFRDNASNDE